MPTLPNNWGGSGRRSYDTDAMGFPLARSSTKPRFSDGIEWGTSDKCDGGGTQDDCGLGDDDILTDEDGWIIEDSRTYRSWHSFQQETHECHRRNPPSGFIVNKSLSPLDRNWSSPFRCTGSNNSDNNFVSPFIPFPSQDRLGRMKSTTHKAKKESKKKKAKQTTTPSKQSFGEQHASAAIDNPKKVQSHISPDSKGLSTDHDQMPWELPSMDELSTSPRSMDLKKDRNDTPQTGSFRNDDDQDSVSTTSTTFSLHSTAASLCSLDSKLAKIFRFGWSPHNIVKNRNYKALVPNNKQCHDAPNGIVANRRKWLQQAFTLSSRQNQNKTRKCADKGNPSRVIKGKQEWESKWVASDGESQVTEPSSKGYDEFATNHQRKNKILSTKSKATVMGLNASQHFSKFARTRELDSNGTKNSRGKRIEMTKSTRLEPRHLAEF